MISVFHFRTFHLLEDGRVAINAFGKVQEILRKCGEFILMGLCIMCSSQGIWTMHSFNICETLPQHSCPQLVEESNLKQLKCGTQTSLVHLGNQVDVHFSSGVWSRWSQESSSVKSRQVPGIEGVGESEFSWILHEMFPFCFEGDCRYGRYGSYMYQAKGSKQVFSCFPE